MSRLPLAVPALLAALAAAAPARAQVPELMKDVTGGDGVEDLMFGMSNVTLGTIDTQEEQKRYKTTIGLEKMRIQRRTLDIIYENAYDMYRQGNYEGAQTLVKRILSIDPTHEDAAMLLDAAGELQGSPGLGPRLTQKKLLDNKFRQGMFYYQQGRLVEASREWEQVVKLYPGNLKARYWLKKVNKELAQEHYEKGKNAYEEHRLRDALDQLYAALLLDPKIPRLTREIGKVETELREEEANRNLQDALNLYAQGKLEEAYETLGRVLEILPGDPKAQKLYSEVRFEIAKIHVRNGRSLYQSRKYLAAIDEWKVAQEFGYDPRQVQKLIARAREQMDREKNAAQRAKEEEELRRQREEEERLKREQEEAEKKERPDLTPRTPAGSETPGQVKVQVTEQERQQAERHYLKGLQFFQNGDLEKARNEWTLAKQLDPGHQDADMGLKRIEQMVGARP